MFFKAGDMVMMNTQVRHFGCDHKDFHGSSLAADGEAPYRRRLFMYFDHPDGEPLQDHSGYTHTCEGPAPIEYKVQEVTFDNLHDAMTWIASPLLELTCEFEIQDYYLGARKRSARTTRYHGSYKP